MNNFSVLSPELIGVFTGHFTKYDFISASVDAVISSGSLASGILVYDRDVLDETELSCDRSLVGVHARICLYSLLLFFDASKSALSKTVLSAALT